MTTHLEELAASPKHTIGETGLEIAVAELGAEMQSLKFHGIEYLWQGDPRYWDYRSPTLFPNIGFLRNNRAETDNGPAPLQLHGIARLYPHHLIEKSASKLAFRLTSNDEMLAVYPYRFTLFTTFTIFPDDTVEQRYRVVNNDEAPMPFTIGGHPGFNVPLDPASDEHFEDYRLEFTQPWTYKSPTLNADHLIDWNDLFSVVENSNVLPLTHRTYDIDTIIFHDVPDRTITLRGTKTGHGVRVAFPGFDYCGSWSAPNDAPFVCVEPWTGCATGTDEDDVLAHKRGMRILQPDESFEIAFTMQPF